MVRTLVFDIGGTAVKCAVLDANGQFTGDPAREPTPAPATPPAVLDVVGRLAESAGAFDRVSVGYPGVVRAGVTWSAANLGPGWVPFDLAGALASRLGRPAKVINDAGMHGFGVIRGDGTEVVVTLGTGMGFGLYVDGRYVPNVELGHHPFQAGRSYEQRVCDAELAAVGVDEWKRRVGQAIAQIRHTFNFDRLYLGGGNARLFDGDELDPDVSRVENASALVGGWRLWA